MGGLPINVIEAQLMGLIVVLRDTIQVPELIQNNITGYIFRDSYEFRNIISSMFTNIKNTKQMIIDANNNANDMFSDKFNDMKWLFAYQK